MPRPGSVGVGSILVRMETPEGFAARLRAAQDFASLLVGLSRTRAEELAMEAGYPRIQVVSAGDAVTLELDASRIRLVVDENDVVIRASGG